VDLIKTQTIGSAVSSVPVSDVFSSTYDNYLIQVSGGAASTSNWGNLTLGSTNTGYYWYEMFANYSATTLSGANAQNTTSFRDAVGGTTDSVMGEFALYAPNLAKNTHFKTSVSTARTAGEVVFNSGYLANTTQYTAFTLTTGSGTWTGGTIAVYGYAK